MLWLYRFFCGYVLVAIKGNYSERLINTLVKKGISVWHIKKKKDEIIACIFARDFKRFPDYKGKSGVKIHILSKTGVPFIVNKYKHRPGLAVGVILFFAIIYFLSGSIWNIKVNGNNKVSEDSIISACRSIGIYEGVRAKGIDANAARVELLLRQRGLSWASINIEGSCATVNVREFEDPKKSDEQPCNLKSAVSGIVVSTKVTKVDVCVKPGDTELCGQLLVSGAVTHADGSTEFVKSEGEVIVEAARTFSQAVDLKQTKTVKTGKQKKRSVLNFFGFKIPLFLGGIKGGYEKTVRVNKVAVDGNYVPIYTTTACFAQTKEITNTLDKSQAIKQAKDIIEAQTKEIEGFIEISYSDNIIDAGDSVMLKRQYKYLQNAVIEEKLLIDTFN